MSIRTRSVVTLVEKIRSTLVTLACLPALATAQTLPVSELPADTDTTSAVGAWLTAGAGLDANGSHAGLAGVVGGSIGVDRWSTSLRYSKSMGGGGSDDESYSERLALLVGRSFDEKGRFRLAAGITRAKRWGVHYSRCRDCWFGDRRREDDSDGGTGTGLALAMSTRGDSDRFATLGFDLAIYLGGNVGGFGLTGTVDVGAIR